MAAEGVPLEVVAEVVGVAGFFQFAVDSDVATQQADLRPHVNPIVRRRADVTVSNHAYTPEQRHANIDIFCHYRLVNAKFHYAILVEDRSDGRRQVRGWSQTCSELEFGLLHTI